MNRVVLMVLAGAWLLAVRDAGAEVRFNRDVKPILADRCFSCHGPDEAARKAELRLDVRAEAVAVGAIAPRDPGGSLLVQRIHSEDPDLVMPPPGSNKMLTASEKDLLRQWIEEGAPYEQHWAFLSPQRPALPEVQDAARIQKPLDYFVQHRLESEGLGLSPSTSRAEWIRRVSLDLTGLPPTLEEIDSFLKDQSDSAWEAVVDRLLKSPRYGEHMARYWLDAARYADTNGYQYDLEREQWVWRDWVIHAFNSNMPFDQFTIEQIAGDLLESATPQQKLATAFHRNHPITIEGGVIDEEYRMEYVADRVVTTANVWLGLTLVCSRCHDHKYDPISQREFYQLFAYFNQVPERGLNGFNPKLQVSSPLQLEHHAVLKDALARSYDRAVKAIKASDSELTEWATELSDHLAAQWNVAVPDSFRSEGGADLTPQEDHSILVTGKKPANELYELTFDADSPVFAIQLEALTDPSLVSNSTGRAFNGNFVLSEIEVEAAIDQQSEFKPVAIASAESDYSQKNYDVSLAVDGKIDNRGWAVDGNTRFKRSSAVFRFEKPLPLASGGRLRVKLHHRFGSSHSIGRFRVSLAKRDLLEIPAEVATAVLKSPDQRTPKEQRKVGLYLLEQHGNEPTQQLVADIRRLQQEVDRLAQAPATMVLQESPGMRKTHVLMRGEYDKPGAQVQPQTPSALPRLEGDPPANRLTLARWLVMPQHPLTARVTVNRLWQQLFGRGLVATVQDFGTQGEFPSHPQLLDWLAVEFVESGWDVKATLKLIVLSGTYRQTSVAPPELATRDPNNRLLGRGPRFRLDAEVIRDSSLFASGLLSPKLGGPSVFPYHPQGLWEEINNRPGYSRTYKRGNGESLYRRSVYTFWKRTVPPPTMSTFDAPDREYCVVQRSRTNTPLQAIVLLHDPQFVEAARQLGLRMLQHAGKTPERLTFGFRLCFSRKPNSQELATLEKILEDRLEFYRSDDQAARKLLAVGEASLPPGVDVARVAAWASVGRVLFNLSEFVTKG